MYSIGIDLGGTNIATGIVDETGKIIETVSLKTMAQRAPDEIIEDMGKTVFMVCEKAGIPLNEIYSVGIGAPGSCSFETGDIIYTNNIPLSQQPLGKKIAKITGKTTYVSNDANCAAYGETICGAAKGSRNVILVTLGTGVGGGIIIDGKIYEGSNGAGGELGHTVLMKDGEPCTCGRKGCLEAYASATGLIRQTRHAMYEHKDSAMWQVCGGDIEKVNGQTSFTAMQLGDISAKQVVENYTSYLAEGLTNFINIFQPEIVLIGGGISNQGEVLLDPLRKKARGDSYGSEFTPPARIEKAMLGNNAGIIGAAMLYKNITGF